MAETKVVEKKRKRSKKRGRNDERASNSEATKPRAKQTKLPFSGLILAVSTLDIKGQAHDNQEFSYKAIATRCKSLGAEVTGQVHARVAGIVCTRTSVMNATQRVRKALKKDVPLLDVTWLRDCESRGQVVDMNDENYRLEGLAKEAVAARKQGNDPQVSLTASKQDSGWTEPLDLGCCCVCHENGDDQCPWCVDGCESSTAKT